MMMTPQMFECREKPELPNNSFSDSGLATYIVRLVLAHDDCMAQLSTVRNHLEVNGVRISEHINQAAPETTTKHFRLF